MKDLWYKQEKDVPVTVGQNLSVVRSLNDDAKGVRKKGK